MVLKIYTIVINMLKTEYIELLYKRGGFDRTEIHLIEQSVSVSAY